jgi:selenocysteine lyase/cysteine desulfurase
LAADPDLLETLRPDKLLPSSDAVPERFELGTLPYELLAGVTAAVDFLAALAAGPDDRQPGDGSLGDRRAALGVAFGLMEAHESRMLARLDAGLDAMPAITRYGRTANCTPTRFFSVAGCSPQQVRIALAAAGVNAPAGHFYAIECSRWLGLGDDGAVRAGIALYTDTSDIDRLLTALAEVAAV